ncbi:MAG: hypothetical protein Q9170_001320 [Blastenia crenularia]
MASIKRSSTAVEVKFASLKNCLANLPQSLINVFANTNTPAQDVIVEILIKDATVSDKDQRTGQRSVYVGWSGMPSTQKPTINTNYRYQSAPNSKDVRREELELDSSFGRTLGLAEGQKVGLLLHLQPPLAHTVHIEPLTAADWEVIELHANFLELNLLSQIRALPNPSASESPSVQAQHAHPLTLHLSPTSTANIIVTSLEPPLVSTVPFAKLAPDAEVVVAPKSRPRLSDRRVSRSIGSTGRKSASGRSLRSSGRRHNTASEKEPPQRLLLLRPCDRKFCEETFDNEDQSIQGNVGLKIWLDPEIFRSNDWESVSYVSVSIIRPVGIDPASGQSQRQRKKDVEHDDTGKPTLSVVAELVPCYNAPSLSHAALSSPLCAALQVSGIVGGMIEVKAAPPPVSKHAIHSLQVIPFLPSGERKGESVRLSEHSQLQHDSTLKRFTEHFWNPESSTSLFQGPLTDGLIVPPLVEEEESNFPWRGGLLRFVWRPRNKEESQESIIAWVNGLDQNTVLETGIAVANPLHQTRSSGDDDLPYQMAPLIGVETISDQLLTNLSHSSSVLLTGGLGSGKTPLAKSVGCQLRLKVQSYVSYTSCRKLAIDENSVSTIKDMIERLFTAASWAMRLGGQSLVILDDLDKLCPVVTELQTQDNSRSNQVSELICNIVRRYCAKTNGVTFLVTAQSQDSLNSVLIGANLFKDTIALKAPDKDRRRKLLQQTVGDLDGNERAISGVNGHASNEGGTDHAGWMDGSLPSSPGGLSNDAENKHHHLDLLDIAGQTDGYMPADLALLVSRAKSEALVRSVSSPQVDENSQIKLTDQDFHRALKGFAPASLRNVTLQSSKITFDSIGGLKSTRKTILETLQYPTLYAPIFARCPLRLRSGLLLYGYPGCGKTLLASAVAGECGLNFISVKGPEILNKYIGASEKSVRDLFDRAESARPCVLFFDEFDSIAPKRGHDSTGVTDRVVNQLLTQMDGAEGLSGVYVLAATSRPDLIDPALLRPGRLDKSILCDLPDFEDRLDILTVIGKKLKMDPRILSSGRQSLHEVAQRTEGYSGADLQAVVYNAHLEAIHDEIGDQRMSDKVGKKAKGTRNGRLPTTSDILRFRFGKEADAEIRSSGLNRTAEIAEYHSIVAKLEELRRTKRIERRRLREPSPAVVGQSARNGERKDEGVHEVVIQWKHIEASLASTRSSISPQERERLKRFYREFTVGRSGELPNGEGSTEVGGRSSLM